MSPVPLPAHLHDAEFDAWLANTPKRWQKLDASGVVVVPLRAAMRVRRELEIQAIRQPVRLRLPSWRCDALDLAFAEDLPESVHVTTSDGQWLPHIPHRAVPARWVDSADAAERFCTEVATILSTCQQHPRRSDGRYHSHPLRPPESVVATLGQVLDNALIHGGTGRALVTVRYHRGMFVEFVVIDLGQGLRRSLQAHGLLPLWFGDAVALRQAFGLTTTVVSGHMDAHGGLRTMLAILQRGGAPASVSVESGHARLQVLIRDGRADVDMVLFPRPVRGCTVWIRLSSALSGGDAQ